MSIQGTRLTWNYLYSHRKSEKSTTLFTEKTGHKAHPGGIGIFVQQNRNCPMLP